MATIRQKRAFKGLMKTVEVGEYKPMGQIIKEAGFGIGVQINPHILTKSKGWQELMAQIDDEVVLTKVLEIALDKSDKRACLAAADMIFKLKDRYPAGKLKVTQYQEELEQLNESRTITKEDRISSPSEPAEDTGV